MYRLGAAMMAEINLGEPKKYSFTAMEKLDDNGSSRIK
jgi:hypothetical protein